MDMTEKERHDTKMATLYELRLLISKSEKTEFSKDEILEIIDAIAAVKDQK